MFRRNRLIHKEHIVVVGTGWAASAFAKTLDTNRYNITVLSQRNHMVFTPLLASTVTGTLEFRAVCEPISRLQPQLAHMPNRFLQTHVYGIDLNKREVQCVAVGVIGASEKTRVQSFSYHYDKLVLAHGAKPNTFNVPGVEDSRGCFYLREITDSRAVRRRIVQNIMQAKLPTTSQEERARLLHLVLVGGGPTCVELAGELSDFLHQDLPRIAPDLRQEVRVTLVEAGEVLGTFDSNLRHYAARSLERRGINIVKGVVSEVTDSSVVLSDGKVLECGVIVWSTGVGASSLSKSMDCDKNKQGRLAVNDHLQILRNGKPVPDAFALGDCAANVADPLPTLAAVASRQGAYLAKTMNKLAAPGNVKPVQDLPPFTYSHLLSMASLGGGRAVAQWQNPLQQNWSGLCAFLLWRSAYFTLLGSWRSKLWTATNWFGTTMFGRDVTYIGDISEEKTFKKLAREGAGREMTRKKLLERAEAERIKQDSKQQQQQPSAPVDDQKKEGASSDSANGSEKK